MEFTKVELYVLLNLHPSDRSLWLLGANLIEANLIEANLSEANLSRADLVGADLIEANLPNFQICPSEGSFVGWKATPGGAILKLEIPADAVRTSSLVGRKCRATHVRVLEALGSQKPEYHTRNGCVYQVGEITWADAWDDDIRIECTSGIHFFMTLEEAEEWL
jgi:hypothetical protein